MSHPSLSRRLAKLAAVALLPIASAALAQNAAVVNNKPIPKQKVDDFVAALAAQAGLTIDAAIARANRAGRPAMIYVHPWELDPEQPRLPCSRLTRARHYVNLRRTASKLDHLLSRHRFAPAVDLAEGLSRDRELAVWSLESDTSGA